MDILLVGGGHAHLGILRRIRMKAVDYQVTLISDSTYQYYSGMFSGFTEGLYSEQEIRINLEELCQQSGVTFIKDTIVNVDATNRKLVGTKGPIRCRLKGFSEWIFDERLLSWKIHAPSWKKAMPSWKI
ncbi:MAG TPA: hypothetical protein VI423_06300 [Paenisporosarcina sp.]|nr:hypothetical protein [Paenisporosarcina sp.]